MKKKIFSVLFALVLALGFSLVTVGPMATPALAASGDFQTRQVGNWNAQTTWIKFLTGTVQFTNGSTAVTGTGTSFTTELATGDVLMLQASAGTVRGTVSSITDNTHLTLTLNATANASGAYGKQAVPSSADGVITIGHAVTVTANVTVDQVVNSAAFTVSSGATLTVADGPGTDFATLSNVAITINGTLNVNGTMSGVKDFTISSTGIVNVSTGSTLEVNRNVPTLTVNGNLSVAGTVTGPTLITIGNGGTATVSGTMNITYGSGDLEVNAGGNLNITGGSISVSSVSKVNVNGTITMSGAGTLSVSRGNGGPLIVVNSGGLISMSDTSQITTGAGINVAATIVTLNSGSNLITGPSATIGGTGEFLSKSGASMSIGSTAGITSSGLTGNIQVSSTRSYNTGANYTYIGTAVQVTGSGLPATLTGTLTIDNSAGVSLAADKTINTPGSCVVNSGALLTMGTTVINGTGAFTLSSGGTLGIGSTAGITSSGSSGNIQTTTRHYDTGANYTYNGTAAQNTGNGLPEPVNNLTINNANGVTLNSSPTISGTLTLTSGNITTGINTVIIGTGGSVSRTSGHVVGNLQKNVTTGSSVSRTFEVGTGADYTPIDVTFASVNPPAGTLTVSSTAGDHPNLATSGIDPSKSVNRYWTITNSGVGFTTYDAKFTFVSGDKDAGANTANFIVQKYNSSTWTTSPGVTRAALSTTGTGFTSFSDFVVGEPAPSTAAEITAYSFAEQTGAATINSGLGTIDIEVANGTDVTDLVATFTTSADITSIQVGGVDQVSATTANDFTSPVTYVVKAQDGTHTKNWVVTVSVAKSTAAEITVFDFNALAPAVVGVVTEGTHTIALTVPSGTDVTALVPTITITGASVAPASGVAQNFTVPVVYTVTAADASTQDYTVTVTIAPPAQYDLTMTVSGNGTVTPGNGTYPEGDMEITATAADGWTFAGWTTIDMTEIDDPSSATTTLNLDKDKTVIAFFTKSGATVMASKTQTTAGGDQTVDAITEADTEVIKSGDGTPTITVVKYSGNPGTGFSGNTGKYIDVHIDSPTGVTEIVIKVYYTNAEIAGLVESSLTLRWWNGTSWVNCSDSGVNTTDIAGPPAYSGYMWAKIRSDTIPTLAQLSGAVFGGGGTVAGGGGGGGGGGFGGLPASFYASSLTLALDMQGNITTVRMTRDGVLYKACLAKDTSGKHTLQIDEGTKVTLAGNTVPLILRFHETSVTPPTPENTAIVGPVYEINAYSSTFETTPSPITISPPARLILTYEPDKLPKNTSEVFIANYDTEEGWLALAPVPGVTAEVGKANGLVSHCTPFAVLAKLTAPTPAKFEASNLTVSPSQAQLNQEVAISVNVANTGGSSGDYTVELKVDGTVKESKRVTLAAGASQIVNFTITGEAVGRYQVEIAGLNGEFVIAGPTGLNWWLIGGIIAAIILALVTWMLMRWRRFSG